MNEKLYTENPDNPFLNIQPEDRRILLKILYPTIDWDLIFYPKCDNEKVLDEFGLPTRVNSTFPYIITSDKDLEEHLKNEAKMWVKKRLKFKVGQKVIRVVESEVEIVAINQGRGETMGDYYTIKDGNTTMCCHKDNLKL